MNGPELKLMLESAVGAEDSQSPGRSACEIAI
jgi:hypothetical protein